MRFQCFLRSLLLCLNERIGSIEKMKENYRDREFWLEPVEKGVLSWFGNVKYEGDTY